jgi:hypothetical protein
MSRSPSEPPDRLLATDATEFERRIIDAALMRRPPAAASARMAKVLGVAFTGVATSFPAKALGADVVAPKAAAVASASTLTPWISVGLLGLAIGGAVVGARAWRAAHVEPASASSIAPAAAPVSSVPIPTSGQLAASASDPVALDRHGQGATAGGNLSDEITFVDAARTAAAEGDGRRALEVLRRYHDKYPSGSFRPEATAIRIEALMKLDRQAEARELATRFVAENRGSLLAARVAALVGLPQSSAEH